VSHMHVPLCGMHCCPWLSHTGPKGFYNPRDSYTDCQPCPGFGLTTEGVGLGVNLSSCGIAAGFGYSEAEKAVVPCPIGELSWGPAAFIGSQRIQS
jgi:hypothetical protein